jgi:hypothetical protein
VSKHVYLGLNLLSRSKKGYNINKLSELTRSITMSGVRDEKTAVPGDEKRVFNQAFQKACAKIKNDASSKGREAFDRTSNKAVTMFTDLLGASGYGTSSNTGMGSSIVKVKGSDADNLADSYSRKIGLLEKKYVNQRTSLFADILEVATLQGERNQALFMVLSLTHDLDQWFKSLDIMDTVTVANVINEKKLEQFAKESGLITDDIKKPSAPIRLTGNDVKEKINEEMKASELRSAAFIKAATQDNAIRFINNIITNLNGLSRQYPKITDKTDKLLQRYKGFDLQIDNECFERVWKKQISDTKPLSIPKGTKIFLDQYKNTFNIAEDVSKIKEKLKQSAKLAFHQDRLDDKLLVSHVLINNLINACSGVLSSYAFEEASKTSSSKLAGLLVLAEHLHHIANGNLNSDNLATVKDQLLYTLKSVYKEAYDAYGGGFINFKRSSSQFLDTLDKVIGEYENKIMMGGAPVLSAYRQDMESDLNARIKVLESARQDKKYVGNVVILNKDLPVINELKTEDVSVFIKDPSSLERRKSLKDAIRIAHEDGGTMVEPPKVTSDDEPPPPPPPEDEQPPPRRSL